MLGIMGGAGLATGLLGAGTSAVVAGTIGNRCPARTSTAAIRMPRSRPADAHAAAIRPRAPGGVPPVPASTLFFRGPPPAVSGWPPWLPTLPPVLPGPFGSLMGLEGKARARFGGNLTGRGPKFHAWAWISLLIRRGRHNCKRSLPNPRPAGIPTAAEALLLQEKTRS